MLQMGIQPEGERKNNMGGGVGRKSVFPETDLISLFSGLLIYFLLYIGMGSADLTLVKIRCFV